LCNEYTADEKCLNFDRDVLAPSCEMRGQRAAQDLQVPGEERAEQFLWPQE